MRDDRATVLADVSRRLGTSLDYETTLRTVANLLLPYEDAWAIVDVLTDDGSIRRLPVHHPDPARQTAIRALHERYPPDPGATFGAANVIRSGRALVMSEVSDQTLVSIARDEAHLELLRAVGPHSFVSVPMIAREQVIGALTIVAAEGTRQLGDVDLSVAEDVAGRAAMAIDNARLHREAKAARSISEAAIGAAEEAGRRKSEFLATMSHEFRTPLNAILGYAQILDMGVLGPTTDSQHAHLERLQASARHLLQLVDDVLDVAKVDAERLEVRQDALVTGASVVSAVALVHPQATAKGIRLLDLGAASQGVPFIGDERRVRQILVNLFSNAVKFTPSGGEVTVNCGTTNEPDPGALLPNSIEPRSSEAPEGGKRWAFIRVADSGPGIEPHFMARLFEPFEQADGALTREKGGTGLGLAISRRLARRMGGDLTARSRPGSGAVFTLWLPMPVTPAEVPTPVAPTANDESTVRRTPAGTLWAVTANGAGVSEEVYSVVYAIGTKLSINAEVIAERYVAAIRADERFPGAHELHAAQLRDHATPLVGLVASQITIIGETGGRDPELLADGGQLLRLMSELHGAQRHRLGWTEADIEREGTMLKAEVERSIRASVDTNIAELATSSAAANATRSGSASPSLAAATRYALDVAFRALDLSLRTAIRTHRFAKNADAP